RRRSVGSARSKMTVVHRPPRLARAVLRFLVREADREFLVDDLDEEFAAIAVRHGTHAARRRYWTQTITSIPPLVAQRILNIMTTPHPALPFGGRSMEHVIRSFRQTV